MKAVIVDIDGVVLHDNTALPGAPELVEWLVGSGRPFLFLTNYPSMTPADLAGPLPRRGAAGPDMIRRAAWLIQCGARFVATNPDVAGPQGRPSCGALAAPIERISGKRPFYVGKPSAFMMRAALRYLQAHSEDTWMVGDNMDTDIIAGIQSGLETVLVLSGVSRAEELPGYAYRPHHVARDAHEVLAILRAHPRA